jgi:Na+-driven multidrug efflux pump
VLEIAPGILRLYGLSYILLPFNIFATYYFQAAMQPRLSTAVSLARGTVISGGMILLMPCLLGADALWLAMLVTETLVAGFCAVFMVRCTRKLCMGRVEV